MLLKGKNFREHCSGLFVSADGEVFIPKSGKRVEHFTFGCTNSLGYKQVKYKGKQYLVHRLVAECYLPNPDNLPTIDHIDMVRSDNRVENLRWADYSLQNTNQHHQKNNSLSKPVLQYTLEGQLVSEWPSINECGRNGFNQGHIWCCCNGKKYKTHRGFKWKHKNEELEQI